jgi:hypothetical protein
MHCARAVPKSCTVNHDRTVHQILHELVSNGFDQWANECSAILHSRAAQEGCSLISSGISWDLLGSGLLFTGL